ncbi:hypothetical protein [Actinomadura litoris]|uniref:hypothetical protein n=1 Tax=Actinomadura litoris TaxID=2678616 RepID=UPI001FA6AD80|nr:hypothetical protein [Actinomadura litoris]
MPEQTIRREFGVYQFARHLGLSHWQLRLGREHGLVPAPDVAGERWSARLAEESRGGGEKVIAMFGSEPPIGSTKAAARLAHRVSLDVERGDIEVLVAQGELDVISNFRGHPVYLMRDLDRLDQESVRAVVLARKGPLFESVDAGGAAMILDWPKKSFDRIAFERRLPVDQLGRYALADIHALASEGDLNQQILEEKHQMAIARARRAEIKVEDVVRGWLLRCTAYVDRAADQPPDLTAIRRALRALVAARAASTGQEYGVT